MRAWTCVCTCVSRDVCDWVCVCLSEYVLGSIFAYVKNVCVNMCVTVGVCVPV